MTTGVGKVRSRSANSNPIVSILCASAPPAVSTRKSNPAESTPGLPVSTTTARSVMARSNALFSSDSIRTDITFALPSSMAIVAMASLNWYVTSVLIAALLRAVAQRPARFGHADLQHRRVHGSWLATDPWRGLFTAWRSVSEPHSSKLAHERNRWLALLRAHPYLLPTCTEMHPAARVPF